MLEPKIRQAILKKELRDEKKVVQRKLAEELKVTPQQFSLWVSGESFPRANKLFKLAFLLGVKVDDLYDYIDDWKEY